MSTVHPEVQAWLDDWVAGVRGAPIATLVGARLTAFSFGRATVELDVEPKLFNPRGLMQGGVHAVLADVAMGAAIFTELGPRDHFATTNLAVQYLRAARDGVLTAEAETTYVGGSTAHSSCRVFGPKGDVALITSTCRIARV